MIVQRARAEGWELGVLQKPKEPTNALAYPQEASQVTTTKKWPLTPFIVWSPWKLKALGLLLLDLKHVWVWVGKDRISIPQIKKKWSSYHLSIYVYWLVSFEMISYYVAQDSYFKQCVPGWPWTSDHPYLASPVLGLLEHHYHWFHQTKGQNCFAISILPKKDRWISGKIRAVRNRATC